MTKESRLGGDALELVVAGAAGAGRALGEVGDDVVEDGTRQDADSQCPFQHKSYFEQ